MVSEPAPAQTVLQVERVADDAGGTQQGVQRGAAHALVRVRP
jgi:hypothetical protein